MIYSLVSSVARLLAFLAVALLSAFAVRNLCAQEADPFGAGAEKMPADPMAVPIKPGAKPGPTVPEEPQGPPNPIVESVRESNPTTPAELVRAAETMLNIRSFSEAKRYLKKLIDAKPDLVALATMNREVGSGLMFRFLNEPELQPEGEQVATAVLTAADRYARDPGRMQAMVQKLIVGDALVREQAYEGFRDAGVVAAPPLISALGQLQSPEGYGKLREGLVRIGSPAIEPLIGALSSPHPNQRAQAMLALGRLRARRAIPYLVGPYLAADSPDSVRAAAKEALSQLTAAAPAPEEGALYLRREVDSFFRGKLPLSGDVEGNVVVWYYDAKTRGVAPITLTAKDAALAVASQLAADLRRLDPKNPDYERMYLLAMLEAAKVAGGLDRSLDKGPNTPLAAALQAGPAALELALREALSLGRTPAAIGLCEALGEAGDVGVLFPLPGSTTPRPLAIALEHDDRRVRFAAATAIMKLDPATPYPGASHLPEVLGFLAGSVGTRRALVAHPQPDEAQSLVGLLTEMGYRAEATYTGRPLMLAATSTPDMELLLISDAVDQPRASELVQHLRQDPRTARVPIGIFCREENLRAMERVAELDPLTIAFPKPPDQKALLFRVRSLLLSTGRGMVTYSERVVHASAALDYLAQIAADRKKYTFYDINRQEQFAQRALDMPDLSPQAARVLGLMATPSAQRALVTLASQTGRPMADREAAAKAFAVAVSRRRLLLTKPEIAIQYERYNQSRTLDEGSQQVLGAVLDTIEGAAAESGTGTAEPAAQPVETTK